MAEILKRRRLSRAIAVSPAAAHASSQSEPSPEEFRDVALALQGFDYGESLAAWHRLDGLINSSYGHREACARIEAELVRLLEAKTSLACKQEVCRRLWIVGTDAAVSALEKLLADPDVHVAEAACYALARHPSPAAARALENALSRAQGAALVAVINLLGDRREAAAATQLAELADNASGPASAAIAALGKIASSEAVGALRKLHAAGGAKGREAAHALLESAQELIERGSTAEAKAILAALTALAELPPIRRGATLALQRLG